MLNLFGKRKIMKKNILLIEDSIYSRIQIQEILSIYPELEVIVKKSAEEAISYIKRSSKNIDLFLMDIGLPKMNGIDCLKYIKKYFKKYNSTPVIAITAHVMTTEIDLYLQSGFNTIITKPYEINQLRNAIFNELK